MNSKFGREGDGVVTYWEEPMMEDFVEAVLGGRTIIYFTKSLQLNVTTIYTDGSQSSEGVGAGVILSPPLQTIQLTSTRSAQRSKLNCLPFFMQQKPP
ncbi:hypothetical protein LAZ67_14001037 [Cordylochernes scorpioides]|uniref:Uncharacterized protein n=1 Tax=Cordylochernes scorpioides TaxID=51811 RepID=A0ABY6L9V3_9ARAC|nr:hypothetical protein LAZ67_14001037 [Cordylochernes scorpioides]